MTTRLKRAQMCNFLPKSTVQKSLKPLKANLCSRLQEFSVGSKSLSARVKIGLKFPKTDHTTTQVLSTSFLALCAVCYQQTAIGDMNCGNFEECFTLICDNDSPCPGGGARINLVTSDNKCDSVCIGMGGADGFPDGWRDLGKVPLDPCKLVPGACGGSRPDDDDEPDGAEQEDDEEDTKSCGQGDVFVPIKGNGARHCATATGDCIELGLLEGQICRLEALDRAVHRCQSGRLVNGQETDPIPCTIDLKFSDNTIKGIIICADSFGKQENHRMFRTCLDGYANDDFLERLAKQSCSLVEASVSQTCIDKARNQCRVKCVDTVKAALKKRNVETLDTPIDRKSAMAILTQINERELNDSEQAVSHSLKGRTELGASVLETVGIASFMGGNEELGTEILRTYTKLYPNDPRSWELLSEAYRRRGWPASSESASKIGERLHRE